MFSTHLDNFLPFSFNLKLSCANSFNLDQSKILLSGNGLTLSQTTNYRLYQTERVCRRQFQVSCKWQTVPQTGRKHCRKRRNCSLRAISSFPSVFKRLFLQTRKNQGLYGKGLNVSLSDLKLSSANSFSLDHSKILSSGNSLKVSLSDHIKCDQLHLFTFPPYLSHSVSYVRNLTLRNQSDHPPEHNGQFYKTRLYSKIWARCSKCLRKISACKILPKRPISIHVQYLTKFKPLQRLKLCILSFNRRKQCGKSKNAGRGRKHCGKKENATDLHFLLFPQCFP